MYQCRFIYISLYIKIFEFTVHEMKGFFLIILFSPKGNELTIRESKKKNSINRPQRNHNEWLNLSYLSMQHWKCSMAMSGRVTAGSCLLMPFWTCNYKHWHKFMKMSIRSIILIVFSWNIFEFMKPTGFF